MRYKKIWNETIFSINLFQMIKFKELLQRSWLAKIHNDFHKTAMPKYEKIKRGSRGTRWLHMTHNIQMLIGLEDFPRVTSEPPMLRAKSSSYPCVRRQKLRLFLSISYQSSIHLTCLSSTKISPTLTLSSIWNCFFIFQEATLRLVTIGHASFTHPTNVHNFTKTKTKLIEKLFVKWLNNSLKNNLITFDMLWIRYIND